MRMAFFQHIICKEHWITVSLDDVCDEKIKMLLDISFELTLSK